MAKDGRHSIRFGPEMEQDIRQLARRRRWSFSQYVVVEMEKAIRREKSKQRQPQTLEAVQ